MQKTRILVIGKVKNKSLQKEITELSKRISRLEIVELKEVKEQTSDLTKNKEFKLIKPYLESSYKSFLLWEFGKEYTTKEFHNKIKNIVQPIQLIITGAYGPSEELKSLTEKISLSKMTFTHEQALYMLIEQLYRVECFEKNIPYTK